MGFKCKFIAKDKAAAKLLIHRYDVPAVVIAALDFFIDALEDNRELGDGVQRVVDVAAEGNIGGEHGGMSNMKPSVCYRLVL